MLEEAKMGCFQYLRERRRSRKQTKSSPTSYTGMSRSGELNATREISKSTGSAQSPRSLPSLYEERAHNMRVFEMKELRSATNDFSPLLKIGEGGFGSVYKGMIRASNGKGDKIEVAVKRLNQSGLQGHKQWLAEVQFLGVVEHPNLVKLIGYCAVDSERGPQRLLVYEFVPNKTLDDHLFNKGDLPLPWNTRLQIVLGAAEGLTYLHEGLELQVIYRDFKASNVLLDKEFRPKLSDFGLAREGPSEGRTHVSTAVMGTYGYAAPDYIATGHLTSKSDVWSFGVVLYEVLTGRRSTERHRPRYEQKLLEWVKQFPVESQRFSAIIDPRLENRYSLKAAREVAKLADSCLSKLARDRPQMSEVVAALKQAMEYTDLDGDVEPSEEYHVTGSDSEKKIDDEGPSESLKRRMLHLAKLREGSNMVGRRRYMTTRAARDNPV